MKRETEIKERLISNTIHLIAVGGFESATTKEITRCGGDLPDFKMNEVYIYRLFGSKENLYEAAFICLDNEFFNAIKNGISIVAQDDLDDLRGKFEKFFYMAWNLIMQNEERCRCYVRYYYSIYFKGHVLDVHNKLYEGLVKDISPVFKSEADVFAIFHSVFISLLDFGIRVYNGELEDNEENRPHIFNVLYCMVMTYFKGDREAS